MTDLQLTHEARRLYRLVSDEAQFYKALSTLHDYELNIVLNAFGLVLTKLPPIK